MGSKGEMGESDERLEAFATVYRYIKKPPQSQRQLYEFLLALTEHPIPYKSVCEDHQSPWDLVWEAYKIDIPKFREDSYRNIIALGPRGGQKTLSMSKLMAGELLLKPLCTSLLLAAVSGQSQKAYEYIRNYIQHPVVLELGLIEKIIRNKAVMKHGSALDLTCATVAGTNSWHGPKMRMDEVEIMKPSIIEEAKLMPNSMNGYTSQTIYTSTKKHQDGNMDELVAQAAQENYKVITWCVKEVSEPCPVERRGSIETVYEDVPDIENPGETIIVRAWDNCKECPILPMCKGDLARAAGTVPIDDTIDEYLRTDRSTYIFQKLCKNAKRDNLLFGDWSRKLQLREFDYNPAFPTDLAFDFTNGGESPTVCDIWQEDEYENQYLFAALEYRRMPTEKMAKRIKEFCRDNGIRAVRLQIGDSAQQQMIRDLNNEDPGFFRIVPCKKIPTREGWPLCRRMVLDLSGKRRLLVNSRYAMPFVLELEKARRAKNDPDELAQNCKDDHHLDAWRYREVKLRSQRGSPNIILIDYTKDMPKKDKDFRNLIRGDEDSPSGSLNDQIDRWERETD